jgi:hypothetical protein
LILFDIFFNSLPGTFDALPQFMNCWIRISNPVQKIYRHPRRRRK